MNNANLCKLCLQPKELRESHIISEFDYKPLYDEKHRYYSLSSKKVKHEIHQKGLREKLLCQKCESQRSRYERYVSLVINGGIELGYKDIPGGVQISGIDYKQFKLHQLFLLWMASISDLREFSNFKLPYDTEEELRIILESDNPCDPEVYSCLLCALLNSSKKTIRGLILPPSSHEVSGLIYARFLVSGMLNTFIVSQTIPDGIHEKYYLTSDGILTVYFIHPENVPFLQGTISTIISNSLGIKSEHKDELKQFVKYDLWEKID